MPASIPLCDCAALSSLQAEFRSSMRGLLFDLCEELETRSHRPARSLTLPAGFFRAVGQSLKPEEFSHWKVVGWIEELNDLVYFLDVRQQLKQEGARADFAQSFLAECEEQFYENSYLDELFPKERPEPAKLSARLSALCARLARSVTRESLFLVPGLLPSWRAGAKRTQAVSLDGGPNFERAELPGGIPVGLDGAWVELTQGRVVPPEWIRRPGPRWPGGITLGPTIIYGRDRTPSRVAPTPSGVADRVHRALAVIEEAWPDGARLLGCLTTRIIPLKAKGVVSFSYRHRPGLSFINCFDRDDLDLIDDLIHENSHHHLNLLLRKWVFSRKDRNREIFYSPWRRSLRPLRGILHATFTFTMGAILFERLSSWTASGRATLTQQQVLRARFRCLEEIGSVRYSLRDLESARTRGWITDAGMALVGLLQREIERVRKSIAPHGAAVQRSRYGPALRQQRRELESARHSHGPL